jgi:hypothetical protein
MRVEEKLSGEYTEIDKVKFVALSLFKRFKLTAES